MMDHIKRIHYLLVFSQFYRQQRKSNFINHLYLIFIFTINSSSLSININQKNHFFPSDFFEPICSPTNSNPAKSINFNNSNRTRSTFVNLQKEEEEDKVLLDLLEGKRKIIYYVIFILLF